MNQTEAIQYIGLDNKEKNQIFTFNVSVYVISIVIILKNNKTTMIKNNNNLICTLLL